MSTKTNNLRRKLLITVALLIAALALIFAVVHFAYTPTSDKNRTKNETDIKVNVDTFKKSHSAITNTYYADNFSSFSESEKMKILSSTCGKVEGDVPFVSLKNDSDSYIKIRFQDKYSKKVDSEISNINLYTANGMPVNPKKRQDTSALYNYDYKTGELTMLLSDFIPKDKLVFNDNETKSNNNTADDTGDEIWFCIFEIEYSVGNKNYVTCTAVAVGE